MTAFALRLNLPTAIPAGSARRTFYWPQQSSGSLTTKVGNRYLGPGLGALGPVPQPNVDFVRLAAAVSAADRTMVRSRDGSDWSRRSIELAIPVADPDGWNGIAKRLEVLVGFLSGDDWSIEFTKAPKIKQSVAEAQGIPKRAVLLSGGADSAIGALLSRQDLDPKSQVLVSHFGATILPPIQRTIAAEIAKLLPGPDQDHHQINFTRKSRQPRAGAYFPNEYSTRARSLLFLALGLAVASITGVPLWIPENGFASLNPPLGPDRRGSLSTRTTHPRLLTDLPSALSDVGVHTELSNPFEKSTKGEMFRRAADLIGDEPASKFLSSTHSCAHTGHRALGFSTRFHCGVCFGCVVRRAAFVASGVKDRTEYLTSKTRQPGVGPYLAGKSVERSVRDFADRGISRADVAVLSLPASYPPTEAFDLCERAIKELQALFP